MLTRHRGVRTVSAFLGVLALAVTSSCDDSSTAPQTITVSTNVNSGTIVLGGSDIVTVTVKGSGGFTEAADIAISDGPESVTGSLSHNHSKDGTTVATLTIEVGPGTPVGTHTLTIEATAPGVEAATTTYQLTVPPPSYSISVDPTEVTVQIGWWVETVDVILVRTDYAEQLTFEVEGVPEGVSLGFEEDTVGDDHVEMWIGAIEAEPGEYTLTIRALSPSLPDQTVTLKLTVTAA